MSNILVTGGAGFIGSNYVNRHLLKNKDDTIIVVDLMTYAAKEENIKDVIDSNRCILYKEDILNFDAVDNIVQKHDIDTIVHFAAESHVDRSIEGPDAFIKTNIEGTHTLLKVALKNFVNSNKNGHFHHISTDEVYGTLELDDPSFTEEHPFRPNSPYSASKASSDCLVRAYVHTYNLKATITNCSNNYGPRQFPEKLIPLTITNLLLGKNVPIYGDGQQIRDWLFVDDHCDAIDLAINSKKYGETWNIGGRAEITNLEVVHTICNELDNILLNNKFLLERFPNSAIANNSKSIDTIIHVKDRPGHDRRYSINPTKAEHDLGFKPSLSFKEGIIKTINWYIDNESWWR